MKRHKRSKEPMLTAAEEAAEVTNLEEIIRKRAPPRGTQPFTETSRDREPFRVLPLSQRTLRGLADGGFETMTEIQVAAIPHALAGRDVLGAAKTGSGKTLAFLVPLVEKLYRSRITFGDGLAALVISPTRELALQIFEVLRAFGKHHQLSAGLITGGKKEFREEQASVIRMNILVATPGRLLQHLEQTPGFDTSLLQDVQVSSISESPTSSVVAIPFLVVAVGETYVLSPNEEPNEHESQLESRVILDFARHSCAAVMGTLFLKDNACRSQVLVLDEADRILDLGFREQLNSVLQYLPASRQTMLFSATQTKSIKDLARLSLRKNNVEYVAVRAGKDECATPAKLVQNYVVCQLDKKLDVLLGFIKTHLKSKMIVFFTSCAQVRFALELLCALQPGVPVMALHGKCKHVRRTQIYLDFIRKPAAVLLATDIAARGLDFPSVDWVIQVDAPEDAEGYIHRSGRTARYTSGGRALLILLPSEEQGILAALGPKNIPIKKLTINPEKVRMAGSVSKKAAALVASDTDKKRLAEKSFSSYTRAIQLMPNKEAFRLSELPLEAYALSLGLASMPRVPGLAKDSSTASAESATRRDDHGEGSNDDPKAMGTRASGACEAEREREELRKKKNVNRSLQRLKEQIKAEKLRKRQERESKSAALSKTDTGSRTQPNRNDRSGEDLDGDSEDSDQDGGLILVRKRGVEAEGHHAETNTAIGGDGDTEGLEIKMKSKKMRITRDGVGAVAAAKKQVFDEDGEAMDVLRPLEALAKVMHESNATSTEVSSKKDNLPAAADAYVEKVKARLQDVDEKDRARQRERIREKHLKRRLKGKEKEQPDGAVATLGSPSDSQDEGNDSSSEDDSARDGDSDASGASDDDTVGHEAADNGSDEDGQAGKKKYKARRSRLGVDVSPAKPSIEEQEDAVLQMLASRRKN